MATSGVVTYTVTRDDIIQDALENLGVLADGDSPSTNQKTLCSRKLNMIVKQWQGRGDFARGLKYWLRRTAYIFLQQGQSIYSLGPSGDNATESYVTTTLTADSPLSDTTLTVASITGISNGDKVGIVLDSGTVYWTTVNGSPSGSTVTLTAGVTGAASTGARVFAYTTKMRKPLDILTAVLRDTSNNDLVMNAFLREDYESVANKTVDGTPTFYAYEATHTNGKFYLNCEPSDVTDVIRVVYTSPVEDFTTSTDNPDFTSEWFRPLCAQLAIDCAPAFGVPVTQEMKLIRDESLQMAQSVNAETTEMYFQPGLD